MPESILNRSMAVLALWVGGTAWASVQPEVIFETGQVEVVPSPMTGVGATMDLLSGMAVTVEFATGATQTAVWTADSTPGSGGGGAAGGSAWSLAAQGDAYHALWVLTNTGRHAITRVTLDARPAQGVFDTSNGGEFGTPGSGQGMTFAAQEWPEGLGIRATYRDAIVFVGGPPEGDVYARLELAFDAPGLTRGQRVTFRADADHQSAGSEVAAGGGGSPLLWDNGPDDGVTALLSTINAHNDSVVADDCWLKEGMWYDCTAAVVRMGITSGFEPVTTLSIFADCDGRPDDAAPVMVVPQESFLLLGSSDGLDVYEIRYVLDAFKPGEDLRWFSPVHTGEGEGFWLSAGNGTVQGRQAQFKSAAAGFPGWSDAQLAPCCPVCTDMYLRVEGTCCWRVLDQSAYALDGLTDPALAQNAPWARSFDDFQLADPCMKTDVWEICRIEAYFATNCDLETIFAEIHHNACDLPVGVDAPVARLEPTLIEDLGVTIDSGSTPLPVYRVVFRMPPGLLPGGRNWWLSVFSEQGFAAGKRFVWLFEQRAACDIRLNEAHYQNPPLGLVGPKPVSDPALHGAPRGHAFSVWVGMP